MLSYRKYVFLIFQTHIPHGSFNKPRILMYTIIYIGILYLPLLVMYFSIYHVPQHDYTTNYWGNLHVVVRTLDIIIQYYIIVLCLYGTNSIAEILDSRQPVWNTAAFGILFIIFSFKKLPHFTPYLWPNFYY